MTRLRASSVSAGVLPRAARSPASTISRSSAASSHEQGRRHEEHEEVAQHGRVASNHGERRVVVEGGNPIQELHRPPRDGEEVDQVREDGRQRSGREGGRPSLRQRRHEQCVAAEAQRDREEIEQQTHSQREVGQVHPLRAEDQCAERCADSHEQHGRHGEGPGKHDRPDDQPVARHGTRELEVHEPRFDLMGDLGREVHRDEGHDQADDRVEVAERHRALERGEQHRAIAETPLKECGEQRREHTERLRPLHFGGLADDHDLNTGEQHRGSGHDIPRLGEGPSKKPDHDSPFV